MIKVNEKLISPLKFPDGTFSFRLDSYSDDYIIHWLYDGDEESLMLWYIVNHIREHNPGSKIVLILPYLPNARMDRIKNSDEVFTLKYFAKFINALDFESVFIVDPHSSVGVALIDRVVSVGIANMIDRAISLISPNDKLIYCYPDEGATKKYSEQLEAEYVFGIKHRDWRTGKITGFQLNNADLVKNNDVLIIDDICSRGGTFIHTAKALKEAGANKIYLYVTHCENTIFQGEILTTDLIDRVFTTNSIYRGEHEKITVLGE